MSHLGTTRGIPESPSVLRQEWIEATGLGRPERTFL